MAGRRKKPRVLVCTPEITELPEGMGNAANYVRAKGGGLGDISAGLVQQLFDAGEFQIHVCLPKYDRRIRSAHDLSSRKVDRLSSMLGRRGVHLVSDAAFSQLQEIYEDRPWHPRVNRAVAYQRFVINHLLDELRPDIVHCNDWMTGLIPAAAAARDIRSVFTLHNVFSDWEKGEHLDRSGIDIRRIRNWLYFERFPLGDDRDFTQNRVDFTATGIHAATVVNTVSPSFLREMLAGDFSDIVPKSVRHALREKAEHERAFGILNAPNENIRPETATPPVTSFSAENAADGKARNKLRLQTEVGLAPTADVPILFWPSRLYRQKAPNLLLSALPRMLRETPIQLVVVANGDPEVEWALREVAKWRPSRVAIKSFSQELSDLGRAGSDFVLMPSRYEPCGLPQMESPRFGTLPIVRATGGLRDTVTELSPDLSEGNGFVFEECTAGAFYDAVLRAVDFYARGPEVRGQVIGRVMRQSLEQFSISKTAERYRELYRQVLAM